MTCKEIALRAGLNCGHCSGTYTVKRSKTRKEKVPYSCKTDPRCERWYLHKWRHTYLLRLAHPVNFGLRKAKNFDDVLHLERPVVRIQLCDEVEHRPIRLECRWFLCGKSHRRSKVPFMIAFEMMPNNEHYMAPSSGPAQFQEPGSSTATSE